jgi:hypothetical protein
VLEVSYFSGLGALIIFVGGVVLARTAVRLARDVQPLAPEADVAEPYRDSVYQPAEVSSGALTRPRVPAPDAEQKGGWRRNRAAAGAGANAAYLRWPHSQR